MHRRTLPPRPATPLRRGTLSLALGLGVAGLVALAPPASAHVSVLEEVEAGGIGMVTFVVPNERDDASTVSLEVKIPDEHPLPLVSVQEKPGWESTVTMRDVDEPVELFGNEVTEVVDTVRWTGGPVAPDQFDTFTFRAGPFPEGTDELVLAAVQTYDSGEEVAWIDPIGADGEEPEHPAPVLPIVAADTSDGDVDAGGADLAVAESSTAAVDGDDGTDALTVVALVVAAAAAVMGALALLATRRSA
jgi:uncharacterized protein YcnI